MNHPTALKVRCQWSRLPKFFSKSNHVTQHNIQRRKALQHKAKVQVLTPAALDDAGVGVVGFASGPTSACAVFSNPTGGLFAVAGESGLRS
jgi:hypothetical protein